jgi:hypothetical protein
MSDVIGYVFMFLLFFGGGAVAFVGELVDNHKKRADLKRRLNSALDENRRLQNRLEREQNKTVGGPEVAAMIGQARIAIDDRALLVDALTRVQATDDVVPQLPQTVRALVDSAIDKHRSRLAELPEPTPHHQEKKTRTK